MTTKKTTCPNCRALGGDSKGDNLVLYGDGVYCFSCGYSNQNGGIKVDATSESTSGGGKRPTEVGVPCGHGRTADRVGMECGEVMLGDNRAYTYTDVHGLLAAYKVRDGDKRWWVGDRESITWYGYKGFKAQPKSSRFLIITEGESDCAAATEVTSARSDTYTVVSVPDGCMSNVKRLVRETVQWLRSFDRIFVLFDNDEAGRKGAEHVAAQLPKRNTYVAYITGSAYKDLAECPLSERGSLIQNAVLSAVKHHKPEAFNDIDRIKQESLRLLKGMGTGTDNSTGYPELDKLTGGIQPGDLVVLMADPGQGKTTLFANLAYQQAKQGHKPLFIPVEMTAAQVLVKFAEIHLGRRLFTGECVDLDDGTVSAALDWVLDNVCITDYFGACDLDKLQEWVEMGVDGHQVKSVWLDHITAVVEKDWKSAPAALSRLKSLAISEGVALWTVSHTTTSERDADGTRKVDLRDTRGGQALAQYADCVLGLRRPEGRGVSVTEISTLKIHRFVGNYGNVYVDWVGGRYVPSSYTPQDSEESTTTVSKPTKVASKTKKLDVSPKKQVTKDAEPIGIEAEYEEKGNQETVRLQARESTTQELPRPHEGTGTTAVHTQEALPTGLGCSGGHGDSQATGSQLPGTYNSNESSVSGNKRPLLF